MNQFLSKLIRKKTQLLCASCMLLGVAAPSQAITLWYKAQMNLPIVAPSNLWTCPFPQPNGAADWTDFSPFSPVSSTPDFINGNFRWDNGYARSSGSRIEVPTMARASGNNGYYDTGGMGNRAVIQAIYAVLLNRHTPFAHGMNVDPRGSLLVNDLIPAMYSDSVMASVISQIRKATGITDGGNGTVDQLAAGLLAGSGYYLSCAPRGYLGIGSAEIYTSVGFMGNIDISGFTNLLLNGTVMILQTNKLVWNASKRAWGYGEDGFYLVKTVRLENRLGYEDSYTLYDVATGATKVVTPRNQYIKNVWSTGAVSGSHRVAILDDGNSDYTETILGFAGMDPLVNRY